VIRENRRGGEEECRLLNAEQLQAITDRASDGPSTANR
jgi:hypothetical protein